MTTIKHHIRRHEALTEAWRYIAITLPAIPGVTLTAERPETEPHQRTIRTVSAKPRSLAGVALVAAAQRRAEWFRQALIEIAEGEA